MELSSRESHRLGRSCRAFPGFAARREQRARQCNCDGPPESVASWQTPRPMPREAPERKTPLEKIPLDPSPSPADAFQKSAFGDSTEPPPSDNVQTPSRRQTAGLPIPHVPDHELIRP